MSDMSYLNSSLLKELSEILIKHKSNETITILAILYSAAVVSSGADKDKALYFVSDMIDDAQEHDSEQTRHAKKRYN